MPISVSIKYRQLIDKQNDYYLPKKKSSGFGNWCLKTSVPASSLNSSLNSLGFFLLYFLQASALRILKEDQLLPSAPFKINYLLISLGVYIGANEGTAL
jgi:hypothetical protein